MMHVSPDDAPISRVTTSLFFFFTDMDGKFSLPLCDCMVEVFRKDKKVISTPLQYTNLNLVFPKEGVYKLRVSGAPNSSLAFKAFSVEYDVRVERGPSLTFKETMVAYKIPLSLAFLILILLCFYFKRGGDIIDSIKPKSNI